MEKLARLHAGELKSQTVISEQGVKQFAQSIFQDLTTEGWCPKDIIGVSSHLISLVTDQIEQGAVKV